MRLFKAIRDFLSISSSREYQQRMPANGTSNDCFRFSPSVTRYINEQFSKAYRKRTIPLGYTDYNYLSSNNLIAPEFKALPKGREPNLLTETGREKKKIIPVYSIELRNNKRPSKYTYTCIFKQPQGAKGGLLSADIASKKHLSAKGNKDEIDIASFMDTVRHIRERRGLTKAGSHRTSIKTGKVGRPILRKKCEKDV